MNTLVVVIIISILIAGILTSGHGWMDAYSEMMGAPPLRKDKK
jgi:hypothetical protein